MVGYFIDFIKTKYCEQGGGEGGERDGGRGLASPSFFRALMA